MGAVEMKSKKCKASNNESSRQLHNGRKGEVLKRIDVMVDGMRVLKNDRKSNGVIDY